MPAGAGGADAAEARVRHVARLARMHSAEEAALAAGRAWRAAQWVPAMEGSLRDWRGRLGWTQAEAAAALGLSLRAYQDAEQSGRPCRRERVLACWVIERLARGEL